MTDTPQDDDPTLHWGPATLGIRAGVRRTAEMEHSPAIFTTSSFVSRSAAEAAALFAGEMEGNIYSRFTNPTVRAFEERLARLEGGDDRPGGTVLVIPTRLGARPAAER